MTAATEDHDYEARLLVVDDEPNIRDLLATSLRFAGFEVFTASTGNEAIREATEHQPDLVVLDVMLPDMDGFTVTRRLRDRGEQYPILFLTAKDETQDKVAGLTVGGDDYVTKPFSLEEVVARIRAVLRRTHSGSETAVESALVVGDLRLDEDSHEVHRGDVNIELSPTEFKLLRYLMLNAGRVVYDWSGEVGIVESYISYLRRKIDVVGEPMIHTKRGIGYVLRAAEGA